MSSKQNDSLIPTTTPAGRRASRRGLLPGFAATLLILTVDARNTHRDAGAMRRQRVHQKRRRRQRKARRQRRSAPRACAATATSGITGQVLLGPMCPVLREDEPCPDQPFAVTLRIRDATGHEGCSTQSGQDGRFRVGLAPGTYEVAPVTGEPGGLPAAVSQTVIVAPQQYTAVIVNVDSGIR